MVGQQPNPCCMEPPQGQQYPQPSYEPPPKPKDDNTNILWMLWKTFCGSWSKSKYTKVK